MSVDTLGRQYSSGRSGPRLNHGDAVVRGDDLTPRTVTGMVYGRRDRLIQAGSLPWDYDTLIELHHEVMIQLDGSTWASITELQPVGGYDGRRPIPDSPLPTLDMSGLPGAAFRDDIP